MSDFDRDIATARTGYRPEVAIDAGLRAYMIRVYNYMTAGVALTGLVAWFTFSAAVTQTGAGLELTPFGHTLFGSPLMWVVILAPLGLVMVMSFGINRLSPATALALFFVYSGLLGLSLASIFLVYTGASITRVFFITGGDLRRDEPLRLHDAARSHRHRLVPVHGPDRHHHRRAWSTSSCTRAGSIGSSRSLGVLIFTGLTAYDTQNIKEMYCPMDDGTVAGRKAIIGALRLYLDFINLFLMLLRLFGDRR